jgi:hypothetical protein
MNERIWNPDNEKSKRKWNWLPEELRDDPVYLGWVDLILRRTHYDFFVTVTFRYWQRDDVIIQSTSHLLNVLNRSLSNKKWRNNGRHLDGYVFLERHEKENDRKGSLHVHMIGCLPSNLNETPNRQEFEDKLHEAADKVTTYRGANMINIGEVDFTIPHDEAGLVNYLSKKLTPANLENRTLFVRKEGLTGWAPNFDNDSVNPYTYNELYNQKFEVADIKLTHGGRPK